MGIDVEAIFLVRSSQSGKAAWHVASSSGELPRVAIHRRYDLLNGLSFESRYALLVPAQTPTPVLRAAQNTRREKGDYTYLSASVGEELGPLDETLASDWENHAIGDNSDWVWSCSATTLAADVAEILDDIVEEGNDVPSFFWEDHNYGYYAMRALQLALGLIRTVSDEISAEFELTELNSATPRNGECTSSPLGKIIIHTPEYAEGTLLVQLRACQHTLGDSHEFTFERSFSGKGLISCHVPPAFARSVVVQTLREERVTLSFYSPLHVSDESNTPMSRMWSLVLILRRLLPQNPARVVLSFVLPETSEIGVGFIHDSQIAQFEARIAAEEHAERSRVLQTGSFEELVESANGLIRHGCPLVLPRWFLSLHNILSPAS